MWNYDLLAIPKDTIVEVLTVRGLVRKGRLKDNPPHTYRLNGQHKGKRVIGFWGVEPHSDLTALAWRPFISTVVSSVG